MSKAKYTHTSVQHQADVWNCENPCTGAPRQDGLEVFHPGLGRQQLSWTWNIDMGRLVAGGMVAARQDLSEVPKLEKLRKPGGKGTVWFSALSLQDALRRSTVKVAVPADPRVTSLPLPFLLPLSLSADCEGRVF